MKLVKKVLNNYDFSYPNIQCVLHLMQNIGVPTVRTGYYFYCKTLIFFSVNHCVL